MAPKLCAATFLMSTACRPAAWGGRSCQFRTLEQTITVFLQKSHYFAVVFVAQNYAHCWMAHLDDWRARRLSVACTVCLSQNKRSSLAYIVSIKGNLCWMLRKLGECFSVGGFCC